MWRPAHGATSRPGPCRPASGYGRVLGRPGPSGHDLFGDDISPGAFDVSTFAELMGLGELGEQEVEATAPVTP
jgi:hypothetical protein